ncbi:MAG TPA: protein kinase [Actinoplanes sp.]|nr:protein kinase [Actinoplanes sp.]
MSTTDLPGSSLLANRYRLVERLGAGGMSVVWRAFDEVLGRQVAVKVLPPSTSADPSFRRRLRAEAQAAARLSHPHITNVYDYGEATTVDGEPVPYVVMELVDGESLAAVLARVRRLPWPAAVRICAEVSAALAAAHSRGIVHRDVTPANVMLTPTGAKVVDFGISALIGENDIDPDGSLLGTPAYLAPERLEGGQVSPATDVYAVGLLIYRTLIGQLPWDVGTTTALLRAHQYTEPEPLPPVEGLPDEVSDLVERCLEKHPDDRPSSADLAHVLAGVSIGIPQAHGYVPEWAESGEDTTILPHALPYTEGIGRVRPGHARVADSTPVQAGRGVASVPPVSGGPSAVDDAPISPAPAPGSAIPVAMTDVRAALAGEPVAGRRPPAAPASGAPAAPIVPGLAAAFGAAAAPGAMTESSAVAAPPAPGDPDQTGIVPVPADPTASASPGAGDGGPARAPGRNNRFGPVAATPAAAIPANAPTALRPARSAPNQRAGGAGGTPPTNRTGGSVPGGSTGPARSQRNQTRRVLIGAATVLLLGAAAYGWSLAATDRTDPRANAQPAPSVLPASGKCVVSYAVLSDDGKRFEATVTVANRDHRAIKNWKLWFIMQGDQIVKPAGTLNLDQEDRTVTISSTSSLSAQKAATLRVSGRYTRSNAAPMVFQLGGQTCETYVSGQPGQPSRPVQRLSNGQVRLGPPPTPKPGLKIKENGVVVPVPVPSGSPSPSSSRPVDVDPTDEPVLDCRDRPEAPGCEAPDPVDSSFLPGPEESESPTAPPMQSVDPDPVDQGTEDGGTVVLPLPGLP